ncbi:hypothetical protein G9A89_013012 [Geosiphon pyriformis]|nr:hypothetical protein G9A89_013012 [Geosiphon pyriformis]
MSTNEILDGTEQTKNTVTNLEKEFLGNHTPEFVKIGPEVVIPIPIRPGRPQLVPIRNAIQGALKPKTTTNIIPSATIDDVEITSPVNINQITSMNASPAPPSPPKMIKTEPTETTPQLYCSLSSTGVIDYTDSENESNDGLARIDKRIITTTSSSNNEHINNITNSNTPNTMDHNFLPMVNYLVKNQSKPLSNPIAFKSSTCKSPITSPATSNCNTSQNMKNVNDEILVLNINASLSTETSTRIRNAILNCEDESQPSDQGNSPSKKRSRKSADQTIKYRKIAPIPSTPSMAIDVEDDHEVMTPNEKKKRNKRDNEQIQDLDVSHIVLKKNYKCPECSRPFNRKYNMQSHMMTHNPQREKPFRCLIDGCGSSFTRKHDLKRHINGIHKQERQYECQFCRKSFCRKDSWKRHESTCTEDSRKEAQA